MAMPSAGDIPGSSAYRLNNARVPSVLLIEGAGAGPLTAVDILIRDGHVAAVHAPGGGAGDLPALDLGGRMVWPGLVDMHTHLDKGHIWPRAENPDGTFMGALRAVHDDTAAHWSAEDVAARMEFSLRCAYAHGTVAIRTHLDSTPPQDAISWPVFAEMRQRWQDRIALQAVSLFLLDDTATPDLMESLADRVADHAGVFGAVTSPGPGLTGRLERLFRLAMERGLDLDFHVDETLDPEARTLRAVADTAIRTEFPGRVTVGHCCSLSTQPDHVVRDTLARVQTAGLHVVSLPMCNLYLQDRVPGHTPRRRGVTLLHEMRDLGIPVAVASDNTRDPFYGYGDLDLFEVFTQAARIAHLDRPVDPWPALVARTPAQVMGLDAGVVAPGRVADLVICEGRSFDEFMSRPQSRRIVLRAGRPIDTTPPDYSELDHLFA